VDEKLFGVLFLASLQEMDRDGVRFGKARSGVNDWFLQGKRASVGKVHVDVYRGTSSGIGGVFKHAVPVDRQALWDIESEPETDIASESGKHSAPVGVIVGASEKVFDILIFG
jgi:hypothetical protein